MLTKTAIRAMLIVGVLLSFVTVPLMGQGVSRQEYSGLDKYPVQNRPEDASFVGVRAAEFLEIPVGARGIGMGSAYSAVTDDISSIWWNPAGLGFLEATWPPLRPLPTARWCWEAFSGTWIFRRWISPR